MLLQSYVIKSPLWTILWFRILGIFSVENIKRLCGFMFQTWDNSQLLRRVLWISAELTIVSSWKHKNTQPLYTYFQQGKGPPLTKWNEVKIKCKPKQTGIWKTFYHFFVFKNQCLSQTFFWEIWYICCFFNLKLHKLWNTTNAGTGPWNSISSNWLVVSQTGW